MKNTTFLFYLSFCALSFGQSTATYNFTFTSIWNVTDHNSIPNNAHWSDLVGATHKTEDVFFKLGETASLGIKNVAELGNNVAFNNEVNNAINSNEANQFLQQNFSPFAAISSATLSDIQVTEEFHLITLISMVAPSPDWFIAINSLELRNTANTAWKDSFTLPVFVYDAGTDDGSDYTSPNSANSPVAIFKINGVPINGNEIGTLTVTLQSILEVSNTSSLESIKLFPNPTHEQITISNTQNIDIETIKIYNILGSLVKRLIPDKISKFSINLSSLNSGIYLLKLETSNGNNKTHKIIIN